MESPKIKILAVRVPAVSPVALARVLADLLVRADVLAPLAAPALSVAQHGPMGLLAVPLVHPAPALQALQVADLYRHVVRHKLLQRSAPLVASAQAWQANKKTAA